MTALPADNVTNRTGPRTRGRPVIAVKGVSKRFSNGTLAVHDVNVELAQGEFVSLLGPSGCGKSTLLRMIAGLGAPSAGRIEWPTASHDAGGDPERDLGFVFQDPTLMPWATARDNVIMPLKLKGVPPRERTDRARDMLARVGLGAFENSYPRELSGGMRMRVSIARALVTKPKLLLMDEPFAALDEITRQKLNDDVLRLWKETGITVVFVTHSVFESAYLSNRIVVMKARPGRVHADFPLHTSLERDAHYRTSEEYRQACETVSETLLEAIGGEDAH